MPKTVFQFTVLFVVVYASGQCTQNLSDLLERVTSSSFQSLNSLHDYVWISEEHATIRDGKGKIQSTTYREQNVVADGKMYSRILKPGEEPALPESKAALSADYRVLPLECEGRPCVYPYALWRAISLRDSWNVSQVKEGELQGKKMLVIDLRPKNLSHSGYGPLSGTAWVDLQRCRLLRLQITSAMPNGHNQGQEILEFDEVKGNWLPVRREQYAESKGHWVQEYTYLKFGSSTAIVP